jgi:hypothetical protein
LFLNYLLISMLDSLHREGRKVEGRVSELPFPNICQFYFAIHRILHFSLLYLLVILHSKCLPSLYVIQTYGTKRLSEHQI